MASFSVIRKQVAQTIQDATGARIYSYIPDSPVLPCVVVIPVEAEFEAFARGLDRLVFNVQIVAQSTSDAGAQDWLDATISGAGQSSIRAALFAASGLGAQAADGTTASVIRMTNYGVVTVGAPEVRCWSATLEVEVRTKGTT